VNYVSSHSSYLWLFLYKILLWSRSWILFLLLFLFFCFYHFKFVPSIIVLTALNFLNNKTLLWLCFSMEFEKHNLKNSFFLTLNKFLLHKGHIIGYFSTLFTIILTLCRKAASELLVWQCQTLKSYFNRRVVDMPWWLEMKTVHWYSSCTQEQEFTKAFHWKVQHKLSVSMDSGSSKALIYETSYQCLYSFLKHQPAFSLVIFFKIFFFF
jgi:hypothetical protein